MSLSFLWLLALPAWGQSGPSAMVQERLLLQTDRQLYVSGEVIWFKTFVFDARSGRLSPWSKVAYVELIGPEGAVFSRGKISLDEGRGTGTLELPPQLNSGYYRLRGYTRGMRNGPEANFCHLSLIILQPGQAILRGSEEQAAAYEPVRPGAEGMAVDSDRYLSIAVTPNEPVAGQRSPVQLNITTTDKAGRAVSAEVSLSVALKGAEEQAERLLFMEGVPAPVAPPAAGADTRLRPELRGMRLHGTVTDEISGSRAAGVEVFLAFPGEVALVYATLTDEAGQFEFLLPRLYGLRPVVLQLQPEAPPSLRIELEEAFHEVAVQNAPPFVLPPEWEAVAEAALINAQIQRSYQSFELPPVYAAPTPFDSIPFYGKPDITYRLDDFTRFPLPEFFYEIVPQVQVKGKYGSEYLEMVNEWDRPTGVRAPLMLVDGVPVFDESIFLRINNKLIESAAIVTEPFWLNPRFFNGIVHLSSFDGDGRCFRLPGNALQRSVQTLLPERIFSSPDHNTPAKSRLPDFRNTLYWNPSVRTGADGKATVRFITSDAIGAFEVRAEGVSREGHAGSASSVIEVVKEAH